MRQSDTHVTADESFIDFRSMASRTILKNGYGEFTVSKGMGHRLGQPGKRIYWIYGMTDIDGNLIIHEDSAEYMKLGEMIQSIKKPEPVDEFFIEYKVDHDGPIQKYCEEIYYQQMIKKTGLQIFIYEMRVLAYQRGLKEGIEQNRKALREALGI